MDTLKDIASVIGLILSCLTLLTIFSNKMKSSLASLFKKYGAEQTSDIAELKESINKLEDKFTNFMLNTDDKIRIISEGSEISLEFTKQQCRNLIKEIFYKYYDEKVLPLYEHKTLMAVKKIYIERCHGNSYAQEMLNIMSQWQVDYTKQYVEED